jgi:hypothetical protein
MPLRCKACAVAALQPVAARCASGAGLQTPVPLPNSPPPFPRYQYHNIFSLLRELGGEWPLSDWTTSGFWSPRGLVTQAPVFSQLPRLPTMLGQFVHTFPLPWDIPLQVGALGCRGLGAEGHGASASAQLALAGAPAPPHGPPPAPPPTRRRSA